MRTLDEQNLGSYTLGARLRRDLRVLRRMAAMILAYFTEGRRIRRQYRRCERAGDVYWLDDAR